MLIVTIPTVLCFAVYYYNNGGFFKFFSVGDPSVLSFNILRNIYNCINSSIEIYNHQIYVKAYKSV